MACKLDQPLRTASRIRAAGIHEKFVIFASFVQNHVIIAMLN